MPPEETLVSKAHLKPSLERAVQTLRRGGLIAFPTDTVYGLGCHAFHETAVLRIFEVKGRPPDQGLPLLLATVEDMERVAVDIPELAWKLAYRFWPGGLTLVLKKAPQVPDVVSGGSDTVALRVPNHAVPRALAQGLEAPIVGTSANLSGQPSPTTLRGVKSQLGSRVDLVLAGRCRLGVESTVLDLSGPSLRLLRPGALSAETLEKALGFTLGAYSR